MQTTSRYASRTSASLGEGYSFIALRFLICILCCFFVRSFTHIFDAVFRTRPCKNLFVNGVKNKSIDFGRQSDVDWHPKAKPFPPNLYEFARAEPSTPPRALRIKSQTAEIQNFGMGHTRRGSRNKIPRASCLTLNSLRGTHRCLSLIHI